MESEAFLEKYVNESNAIENIVVGKNHPLFTDHLRAAELVVQSAEEFRAVMKPENIHQILMKNVLSDAGKFRQVQVWVALETKAKPENVEKLMERWQESLLHDIWAAPRMARLPATSLAWHYHHWFEAIHPFVDGNGRTGRLILNNILLLFDLPWMLIPFSSRTQYYESIRQWEIKNKALFEP